MSKSAIVVIFALYCCVSTHSSTDDWYADYPEDGPWIPADMVNINGNISLADVDKIVQEKVATAKNEVKEKLIAEILEDDRLKTVINVVRKKEMDRIRDCRSQNYSYWDDEIPECRSCLMPRCLEHEPCKRECRDILRIDELEKKVAVAQKERKEQKADMTVTVAVLTAVMFTVFAGCIIGIVIWVKRRNRTSAKQVNEEGQDPERGAKKETVWQWQRITRCLFCRRKVNTGSDDVASNSRTEGPIPEDARAFQEEALINGNASPA